MIVSEVLSCGRLVVCGFDMQYASRGFRSYTLPVMERWAKCYRLSIFSLSFASLLSSAFFWRSFSFKSRLLKYSPEL
jgi:hypothetical protein